MGVFALDGLGMIKLYDLGPILLTANGDSLLAQLADTCAPG